VARHALDVLGEAPACAGIRGGLVGYTRAMEERRFDRGMLVWQEPAPGVLVLRYEGHLVVEAAKQILTARAQAVRNARGPVQEFHDWWDMPSYDSGSRTLLTEHTIQDRARLAGVHLLVSSKIVRMGVTVASIPLGGLLVPYEARSLFEHAQRRALAHASQVAGQATGA